MISEREFNQLVIDLAEEASETSSEVALDKLMVLQKVRRPYKFGIKDYFFSESDYERFLRLSPITKEGKELLNLLK